MKKRGKDLHMAGCSISFFDRGRNGAVSRRFRSAGNRRKWVYAWNDFLGNHPAIRSRVNSETLAGAGSAVGSEIKPKGRSGIRLGNNRGTGSEADSRINPEVGSEIRLAAGSKIGLGAGLGINPEVGSDVGSTAGPEVKPWIDSEDGSAIGVGAHVGIRSRSRKGGGILKKGRKAPEVCAPEISESGSDLPGGAVLAEGDGAAKLRIDAFGALNDAFRFQSDIQYLTIIGSIEGHTAEPPQDKTTRYENIIPQLVAVQENPSIKGLLIILNTMGGDVEAGLALAELIATLSKPTVSLVLGGGHSIGVPLATAADHSFIAESAAMTIHPIRLTGLVIGANPTYDYFHKMQDRVVNFIVRTSGAEREEILELMNATDRMANDVGTILFGKEAVEAGIIDEVGGLSQALTRLREMIREDDTSENERLAKKKG